jgi:hypothetical protein
VWVPKVLVSNVKGSKQVWVLKNKSWFIFIGLLLRWNKLSA